MRKIWDIHGGIHPQENKHQSNQEAISFAGIPEELVFPLSQHIGAPATPVVAVGDRVLKGQKIAEAKAFVSVPVHASSSGEVIAIEPRVISHPSGMTATCIVVKTDGQDEWIEHQGIENFLELDKGDLLKAIREAGIAGMGGAGFPSAVKLSTRKDKPIHTLILNGTECEPYITADDRLMRERAEDVIAGAKILRHLIEPTEATLIGVEDNKPEAIAALQAAAKDSGIEIVPFPTKYPSGGEKQLIQILTGKEVPSQGLPADVGIVCQNVGTAVAIHKAIAFGEPLICRVTTVTGDACQRQSNFDVLLGTPVQYLLDLCGFEAKQCSRLVIGGPMMGFALQDTRVPVVKTTNCILAPTKKELPNPPPAQACIRCGMCAEACPVSLLPQQMYWFARGKELEKLEEHNLMDCIECGACSFVCPSNIPLVQYYRASKAEIRQQKMDAQKAEHSKARFEARQARLEREQAEKEAKRAARKAAAQAKAKANSEADTDKADAVQAAIERAKAKKASADPAQAAIERAQAKRTQGNTEKPDKETLQQAVASAEKRLATAQQKLQQAEAEGSDKVDAFRTGVEKTTAKLQQAQDALAQLLKANPATAEPIVTADPAQQAIERAKAKRANTENQSPLEKAQQAVDSLNNRLEKAQVKYEQAKADNSDKLDIFANSVKGLQEKLETAKTELASLQPKPASAEPAAPVTTPPAATGDAAQDAIARALAKREAALTMTDEERHQNAVESIKQRLEKAQAKLAEAKANNDDKQEILATSVEKLEAKLADALEAQQAFLSNSTTSE